MKDVISLNKIKQNIKDDIIEILKQVLAANLNRLRDIIKEYSFKTLAEYNLEYKNGHNLLDLYQDLLQEMMLQRITVEGTEVKPDEYELKVISEDGVYILNPKSSYTRKEVVEEIKANIVIPIANSSLKQRKA